MAKSALALFLALSLYASQATAKFDIWNQHCKNGTDPFDHMYAMKSGGCDTAGFAKDFKFGETESFESSNPCGEAPNKGLHYELKKDHYIVKENGKPVGICGEGDKKEKSAECGEESEADCTSKHAMWCMTPGLEGCQDSPFWYTVMVSLGYSEK